MCEEMKKEAKRERERESGEVKERAGPMDEKERKLEGQRDDRDTERAKNGREREREG